MWRCRDFFVSRCDPVAFPGEPFREQNEALVSIVLLQDLTPYG